MHIIHLKEIESTNEELRKRAFKEHLRDFSIVIADYQTSGRGQVGNTWESERGKNILMSSLMHHKRLDVHNQFYLSMAVATVVSKVISYYVDDVQIKWPNDVYVGNKKIAGILIENKVSGKIITETIVGMGININQEVFSDNIPNPTSLKILTGKTFQLAEVLNHLVLLLPYCVDLIDAEKWYELKSMYMSRLYRHDGKLYKFKDVDGVFEASITDVAPDGRLILTDSEGKVRFYFFKEVEYIIE